MFNESQLIEDFWKSPNEALFSQKTIAAVLGLTEAWCERSRWFGGGPLFIKVGRAVRYKKADILAWLDSRKTANTNENIKLQQEAEG